MPAVLHWKGNEVRAKVAAAAVVAVDATMAAAVKGYKSNHPAYPPASAPYTSYANRTSFLTNSVTIKQGAVLVGSWVRGTWGADANYSLYVEIGTSRKDSGAPRAQVRALRGLVAGMWAISQPSPTGHPLMAPRYSMRPAATAAYRLLAVRIGAAFRGESLP